MEVTRLPILRSNMRILHFRMNNEVLDDRSWVRTAGLWENVSPSAMWGAGDVSALSWTDSFIHPTLSTKNCLFKWLLGGDCSKPERHDWWPLLTPRCSPDCHAPLSLQHGKNLCLFVCKRWNLLIMEGLLHNKTNNIHKLVKLLVFNHHIEFIVYQYLIYMTYAYFLTCPLLIYTLYTFLMNLW